MCSKIIDEILEDVWLGINDGDIRVDPFYHGGKNIFSNHFVYYYSSYDLNPIGFITPCGNYHLHFTVGGTASIYGHSILNILRKHEHTEKKYSDINDKNKILYLPIEEHHNVGILCIPLSDKALKIYYDDMKVKEIELKYSLKNIGIDDIKNIEDINKKTKEEKTLLYYACYRHHIFKCSKHYNYEGKIKNVQEHLTCYCTKYTQEEYVEKLLKNGADPNIKIIGGYDILSSIIIFRNNESIIKMLLKYGANPYNKDRNGRDVFHMAIECCRLEYLSILFENGKCTNVNNLDNDRRTPLHYIVIFGRLPEYLKYYLDKGACVGIKDRWGDTPLDLAKKSLSLHYPYRDDYISLMSN